MSAFVEAVLRRAQSQVGVRENRDSRGRANNTGVEVNAYLRSVGLPPGNPWCAAFVYWAIAAEAEARKLEVPFLRSGYCPDIHAWGRSAGIVRPTPERGDAFLVLAQYTDGLWASHIGFVLEAAGGRIQTVEGNASAGFSNEGDGVYSLSRPFTDRIVPLRWSRLLPAAVTETPTFAHNVGRILLRRLKYRHELVPKGFESLMEYARQVRS